MNLLPDPTQVTIELIKLLPSVLWFVLVVTLIYIFYRPIREYLLPNLSGLKAMGVEKEDINLNVKENNLEISFVKSSLNDAIDFAASRDEELKLAEKAPQWKVKVSEQDKERVLSRAKHHLKIFKDARFLWVDDVPNNNRNESRMFRRLNVDIDIAINTEDALKILQEQSSYDLVISDIDRSGDKKAGLTFLEKFREFDKNTPVIFYIGVVDPEKLNPKQSFGLTNRPDELLHLTMDALERKKY